MKRNDYPNFIRWSILRCIFLFFVFYFTNPVFSQSKLTYKTTFAGNTFSGGDKWVQNFIEDMNVTPDGKVYTGSGWDEGHREHGIYKDCDVIGNEDLKPNSKKAIDCRGNTWIIENFYGRFFYAQTGPVPSGAMAPIIKSSDGRMINDIQDPSAIAIDTFGSNCKLYIADNGPDQNIKIYDISGTPTLIGTFGDKGGALSGSKGIFGPKKLWGIRGLGTDKSGNLWVGNCSFPSQSGGTDLRKFTPDGIMACQLMDLMFVQQMDFDPANVNDIYSSQERLSVDYTQTGKWKYEATTIDPFKYPDDPRLVLPLEVSWVRRINGKKYMFQTNMYSEYMAVFKFEGEIAVPVALFSINWDGQWDKYPWQIDKRPKWDTNVEGTKRWMWRDNNGDGQVQVAEFTTYDIGYPYSWGITVDKNGNITFGGRKLLYFPTNSIDANGTPNYSASNVVIRDVPVADGLYDANRLKYVDATDVMYIATGGKFPNFNTIYQFTDWSRGGTLKQVIKTGIEVGVAFTADENFIYSAGVQKSAYSGQTGEVDIWDAKTGLPVGYIVPDANVQNESGWIDLGYGMNVTKGANNERIIMVEEDYKGKNIIYQWVPTWVPPAEDSLLVTFPANNAIFYYGNEVELSVFTKDTDNSIGKVELYLNDTLLTDTVKSSFNYYKYTLSNSPAKKYSFYAKSYDKNSGKIHISNKVKFEVKNLPDLIVTDITWKPEKPKAGDSVIFSAKIKNIGPGSTPDNVIIGGVFSVDDGNVTWSDTHNISLSPGDSTILTANNGILGNGKWLGAPGKHAVSFLVDDIYRITETNHDNNSYQTSICVAGGNPVVKILSPLKNTTYLVGSLVEINLDAYKCGEDLSKVEIYSGNVKVTELKSAPYKYNFINPKIGDYTIIVKAFDKGGNSVSDTTNFKVVALPAFGILKESWIEIGGSSVNDLISNSRFPASPDSSSILTDSLQGLNDASNFGSRYRGYLLAPQTGNYTFWIASDDNSQLWLSTGTKPAHKVMIANVPDWTDPHEWEKFSEQKSNTIPLKAGEKYYIEVLYKQDAGGGNVAVKWQLPDGSQEGPIPATRIVPALEDNIVIQSPSDSSVYVVGEKINLIAGVADSDNSIKDVEFYHGNNLIGKATYPYELNWKPAHSGLFAITARAVQKGRSYNYSVSDTIRVNFKKQSINSLTLVNAKTDKDLWELHDGDTLNLANFETNSLTVRANSNPKIVGSVAFLLNGHEVKVENFWPYSLFGDDNGNYHGLPLQEGKYILSAIPYFKSNEQGEEGVISTIKITIINNPSIKSFTLVDATNNADLMDLKDSSILDLGVLPAKLNIRANTMPSHVGSVLFNLNGLEHIENFTPYALAGDENGNYKSWKPKVGNYTLSATPYILPYATGKAGSKSTIKFKVINTLKESSVFTDKDKDKIIIYPNPAGQSETVTISFLSLEKEHIQLSVIDVRGNLLSNHPINSQEGINQSEIRVDHLKNGIYYLQFHSNTRHQTLKLIINR